MTDASPLVYLAGPPYADEYRRRAIDWLGDRAVNPMRNDFRGIEQGNEVKIVHLDLADIDRCGILLANFVHPDEGTAMECWYAYTNGKTVIAYTGGSRVHPWTRFVAKAVYPDLEDALDRCMGST